MENPNLLPGPEQQSYTADDAFDLIWKLLSDVEMPEDVKIIDYYADNPAFQRIIRFLFDLRKLSATLSCGALDELVSEKGYILANLKALQSNLRHLTWQTKKIASGDFTQKVDFLGDFSKSFNEMTAKLEAYSKKLTMMARLDQLTQIPNRHFLHEYLANYFEVFRKNYRPFCIVIIDIDFFKRINDTYGHDVGDTVLVRVSEILASQFRPTDFFSRYGGEEFLIVLPETNSGQAQSVAKRALKAVGEAAIYTSGSVTERVTISAGISQVDPEDTHYDAVIKRGDEALYLAKHNGRNCIVVNNVTFEYD